MDPATLGGSPATLAARRRARECAAAALSVLTVEDDALVASRTHEARATAARIVTETVTECDHRDQDPVEHLARVLYELSLLASTALLFASRHAGGDPHELLHVVALRHEQAALEGD